MRLPAGGDRGRPVLRDTRHAMVGFWQTLCPARPQDEAERWPASVSRFISDEVWRARVGVSGKCRRAGGLPRDTGRWRGVLTSGDEPAAPTIPISRVGCGRARRQDFAPADTGRHEEKPSRQGDAATSNAR